MTNTNYLRGVAQKISAMFLLFAVIIAPLATVSAAPGGGGGGGGGASANLDQAENGGVGDPAVSPVTWVNGNVNAQKGHYVEGESIPYRIVIEGLTPNQLATLVIGFDVLQSDKFAIDYITSNDRISETVNPCTGTPAPCTGSPSDTILIPAPGYSGSINGVGAQDVLDSFNALVTDEGAQYMKMWGGSFNSLAYTQQVNLSANDEARFTVTFTPTGSTAVISWGGHISSSIDYPGESAIDIPGSPYHTRLISINGAGGNQDRSLAAGAVTPSANLIVIKEVVNDNGGTATADDFSFTVNGGAVTPFDVDGQNEFTYDVGTAFNVVETAAPGYTTTYQGCSGNIAATGSICTITNDDIAPPKATLTLVKQVNNQAGGNLSAASWTLTADGATTDLSGQGSATGQVDPGTYTLSETPGVGSYQASEWSCVIGTAAPVLGSTVTLAANDVATCTITNTYVPTNGTLNVTKILGNLFGAVASVMDFSFKISGGNSIGFEEDGTNTFSLLAGPYTITEDAEAGYAAPIFGGDCANGGLVSVVAGQTKNCTITNNGIQPKLTLTKVVINDDRGTATTSDFKLYAGAEEFVSGVQENVNVGTYALSETGPTDGYNASYECTVNGNPVAVTKENPSVTLGLGDVGACTITNDDKDPTTSTITVEKVLVQNFGGTLATTSFSFKVNDGSATAFEADGSNDLGEFPAGSYSIVETNPATGYSVEYNGCSFELVPGGAYTCVITNTELAECSDGIDNDGDRAIDYDGGEGDTGCSGPDDDTERAGGSITLDKAVVGDSPSTSQAFNFDFDWVADTINASLSADDTPLTDTELEPGTYMIEELAPVSNNWSLEGIACWDTGENQEEQVTVNGSKVTVNLSLDENVTCTYTNRYTRDTSGDTENIIVKKVITEGSDTRTLFGFNASWIADDEVDGPFDFMLKGGGEIDSGDLTAGETYSVYEAGIPLGWSNTDMSCVSSLDAERTISPGKFVLENGETITCTFTNDQMLYEIYGNVWEDANENNENDEENILPGWTVNITNGEDTFSTTTDENGNYRFFVPRGTWTITEDLQEGWAHTFPDTEGTSHEVTVPSEENNEEFNNEEAMNFLDSVFAFFISTAQAAVNVNAYGSYDFGNVRIPTGCTSDCGGGGGSGPRISLGGDDDDGEVLGDSDVAPEVKGAVAPAGAPNTGMGGVATGNTFALIAPFIGFILALFGVRRTN